MGMALPEEELNRLIDPDIRDIIQRINMLPFVHATYYSCAGTGKNEDGIIHPRHANAMVLLSYSEIEPSVVKSINKEIAKFKYSWTDKGKIEKPNSEWQRFHNAMVSLSESSSVRRPLSDDESGFVFAYSIKDPGGFEGLPKRKVSSPRRVANREFWKNIRKLVDKYYEKGSNILKPRKKA
jgi:hypothetical protein